MSQSLPRRSVGLALQLAGAPLVGVAIGLLATHDPRVSHRLAGLLGDPEALHRFPYALSIAGSGALAVLATIVARRRSLWRSRYPILVALLIVSLHFMAVDAGPINPLNITIVLLFGVWLLDVFVAEEKLWTSTVFGFFIVLFLFASFLSSIGHHDFAVLRGLLVLLPKLLAALVLLQLLTEQKIARTALYALIVSSALAGIVGIAQAVLYANWLIEFTLMSEEGPRYVYLGGLPFLRSAGFAHTAHGYAQPLAAASAGCLALAFSLRRRALRAAFHVLGALAGVGVALSFARSQWVALAVAIACIPFIVRPRLTFHWIGLGVVIAALAIVSGAAESLIGQLTSLSEATLQDRKVLLSAGLEVMASHPWNGVGVMNFGPYSPTFDRYPVHNAPVQVGSELGVLGFSVFVGALVWVGLHLLAALRAAPSSSLRSEIGALLAGYVVIVVGIQGEPLAYSEFLWIYLALCDSYARFSLTASPHRD